MVPVSIVIITKNKADILAGCIEKCSEITDDIVIIENASAETIPGIATAPGCRVYKKNWDGYGANKNKGIEIARYNWILSVDADEVPDDDLKQALHELKFADTAIVYDIKFSTYFGEKLIKFGSWGRDHHIRLFNRNSVKWSETPVHETLILPENIQVKKVKGHIHHYSVKDVSEYNCKGLYYAKLSAKKYFNAGRRANAVKLYVSPLFGFLKNYIIFLGFLDGREGWNIAKTTLLNTWRKYHYLSRMENRPDKKQVVNDSFVVEY
jgi:glycosyltransferase involved in cell wall biosynthesis